MNEQKICPLLAAGDPDYTPLSAGCHGDRCAWWAGNTCAVLSLAPLKSQTFGNSDKKTAPSAANTEGGKEAQRDH